MGALCFQVMGALWEKFLAKWSAPEIGLEQFESAAGDGGEPKRGCTGHTRALQLDTGVTVLHVPDFLPYTKLLTRIDFANNSLESLPPEFFAEFSELQELNLKGNGLRRLPPVPPGVTSIGLRLLDISGNKLEEVDPVLLQCCRHTLHSLNISGNLLHNLPPAVLACTRLTHLTAQNIHLDTLPPDIGCLQHLRCLSLAGNTLTALPASFASLHSLEELDLSGIPYVTFSGKSGILTLNAFLQFFDTHALLAQMPVEVNTCPSVLYEYCGSKYSLPHYSSFE